MSIILVLIITGLVVLVDMAKEILRLNIDGYMIGDHA
jgi:hypothetical protein